MMHAGDDETAVDTETAETAETAEEAPEPIETPDPEVLAGELAAARAQLEQTQAQLEEMTARLRKVSRGFQEQKEEMAAFRSRMEERAELDKARRKAEVVRTFFEPVQNLQRSTAVDGTAEDLRSGVRMVLQQFMDALTGLGLTHTPGAGERFDPNLHEALTLVPVDEASMDGKVVEVYDEGWMVDGRAIRAARVSVGKFVAAEDAAEA